MSSKNNVIILIHGGASSSRMYKDVVPLLSSNTTSILTPDLPGHGKAAAQRPFSFESAVEDIKRCIEETGRSSSTNPPNIMLVGISLGGQAVLAFLKSHSNLVDAAVVSGASVHPPDEKAGWEMPHMPTDKAWIDLMTEDVASAGMENMPGIQEKSFAFTFDRSEIEKEDKSLPVLVMVGEMDTAMARRDFEGLVAICKGLNEKSEGLVLQGAWHNHSIDVPEKFADTVRIWAEKVLGAVIPETHSHK